MQHEDDRRYYQIRQVGVDLSNTEDTLNGHLQWLHRELLAYPDWEHSPNLRAAMVAVDRALKSANKARRALYRVRDILREEQRRREFPWLYSDQEAAR